MISPHPLVICIIWLFYFIFHFHFHFHELSYYEPNFVIYLGFFKMRLLWYRKNVSDQDFLIYFSFSLHRLSCSNATLQHMSKRIPRTKEELLEINGIGK